MAMALILDGKKFPRSIRSVWPARLGGIPTISQVVKRLDEDNSCSALNRVPGAEYRAFNECSLIIIATATVITATTATTRCLNYCQSLH